MIRRLLVVAVAMVILDAGSGPSRHQSRCHGIHGIAVVCSASADMTPIDAARGTAFARRYMHRWNQIVGATHGVYIDRIGCLPNSPHLYTCELRLRYRSDIRCRGAVIDDTWRNRNDWPVVCQGPFAVHPPKA